MRNPNRIPELLLKLCALWEMYPDQRFGQLIENIIRIQSPGCSVVGIENTLWNWEENQWEEAIMKAGEKK